jgi:glycosyltransferase involved in cell wall biosynthesis
MYHANLAGGLAACLSAPCPVIWSIHHTSLDRARSKRLTIWTNQACARMDRALASRVIYCSNSARDVHCEQGYDRRIAHVIPNGFDTAVFRPDAAARVDVRRELRISPRATLIGLFGRFAPEKDHQTFITAAARVREQLGRVHFVLCGQRVSTDNDDLRRWIEDAGLRSCVHLLGVREDIPRLTAALDVSCLSSCSESFPVVVGEAMASEVPCVATDVGDVHDIIGDTGVVVPPGRPDLLGEALSRMCSVTPEERQRFGHLARERIINRFELRHVVSRYEALYRDVCGRAA